MPRTTRMEPQRRQVVRDTLNYYRSVIAGISQVESGKASVDSGQKALEATRAGFEVGTQTFTDVLLAIQTLTSSESSYSQARHQFILNKLLLKQSAGTASLKDIEAINACWNKRTAHGMRKGRHRRPFHARMATRSLLQQRVDQSA